MHFYPLLMFLLLLLVHEIDVQFLSQDLLKGTRGHAAWQRCYTCVNATHVKYGRCMAMFDTCKKNIPYEKVDHKECKQGPYYCCYENYYRPNEIPVKRNQNPYPSDLCK
ncbi:uncharacterized protein LOC122511443 [Leptopilina heterotoma]|uniref:uncharacterized protein LOC122511443 n=1 Tax=Leptopilina heterotoma TaxID=63436 RepID=UPI001CA8BA7F|nr:uncharacterized protein LOC122511443 [Leptopilina heterotoma]